MGFQAAFGSTPTTPTAGGSGFSAAFGGTSNVAAQRQASYVAPPTPPTLLGAIGQGIKQTGSDFLNAIKGDVSGVSDIWKAPAPTPVPVTPTSYLTDIYGTPNKQSANGLVSGGIVGDTLDAWTKATTNISKLGTQPTVGGRVAALTQAGLDTIGAFFQPLNTAMTEAATIPGPVGQLADVVNKGFATLGKVGSNALGDAVQNTPLLSPQQKATLVPLAQQIGALSMQIGAGKVGVDTLTALKDTTHAFITKAGLGADASTLRNVQAGNESLSTGKTVLQGSDFLPPKTPIAPTGGFADAFGAKPTEIAPKTAPVAPETAPTATEVPKTVDSVGQAKITDPTQFSRATGLTPEHQTLEDSAFNHVVANEDAILQHYKENNGNVVNADNFRPYFKDVGYAGHNAAAVQEPASYLAKRARTEALKQPGDYVVGTAGGSGVGKTSALKSLPEIKQLHDNTSLVLDSNFSSLDSAHKFINEVQASGKQFRGVFTYRDAIDALENGIVKRMLANPDEMGRVVPNEVSAGNHIGSFDVVKKLVDEGHQFHFIDNSLGEGKAKLVTLDELKAKVNYAPKAELKSAFDAKVKELYDNQTPFKDAKGVEHTITKAQYDALTHDSTSSKGVKVQKTGEITRTASNINDTLVKQGYDALPADIQSKYTPESYKAELIKSQKLVSTNYEDAVARATGNKPVGNYEGQILFNEVERVATEKGDYNTLTQLASSPLGKKLSLAAQTMGAHGFNDNPNSAVDAIRSVQDAREAAVKAKGVDIPKQTDAIIKEIKRQTAAARSPRPTWEAFVEQITCGY